MAEDLKPWGSGLNPGLKRPPLRLKAPTPCLTSHEIASWCLAAARCLLAPRAAYDRDPYTGALLHCTASL